MKAGKQKQKATSLEERERGLRSIAGGLLSLANNLERYLARSNEGVKGRGRSLSGLDPRVHEYKIEAGGLLDWAVRLGGFEEHGSLRRLVGSQRDKLSPNQGYKDAFELACWKWIPRQPDGFDFAWKRKQVGEVKAYILGMRYLADCLAKSLPDEVGDNTSAEG